MSFGRLKFFHVLSLVRVGVIKKNFDVYMRGNEDWNLLKNRKDFGVRI